MRAPCDVCTILKGDAEDKDVHYCSLCDSNICAACAGRYDLRAIAAMKKHALAALEHFGLMPGRA